MPRALSREVKLDIPHVARFIAEHDGAPSPQLLAALQARFNCRRRAAQDALTILVRGGWLERRNHEEDGRRKRYYLTAQAHNDLDTIRGERDMRSARRLHSTTSTRARKQRAKHPHP